MSKTENFTVVNVHPSEIREGDRFVHNYAEGKTVGWVATCDANVFQKQIHVGIQNEPDGGHDVRVWGLDAIRIDVQRPLISGSRPTYIKRGDIPEVAKDSNSESFEFRIIISGKERIEQVSDMLQAGGDENLMVEIERLIGNRLMALNPREHVVMDLVPNGVQSTTEILNSILVDEL